MSIRWNWPQSTATNPLSSIFKGQFDLGKNRHPNSLSFINYISQHLQVFKSANQNLQESSLILNSEIMFKNALWSHYLEKNQIPKLFIKETIWEISKDSLFYPETTNFGIACPTIIQKYETRKFVFKTRNCLTKRKHIQISLCLMQIYFSSKSGLLDHIINFRMTQFDYDIVPSPSKSGCFFSQLLRQCSIEDHDGDSFLGEHTFEEMTIDWNRHPKGKNLEMDEEDFLMNLNLEQEQNREAVRPHFEEAMSMRKEQQKKINKLLDLKRLQSPDTEPSQMSISHELKKKRIGRKNK